MPVLRPVVASTSVYTPFDSCPSVPPEARYLRVCSATQSHCESVARSRSSAMAMAAVLPVRAMVRPRRPHLPLRRSRHAGLDIPATSFRLRTRDTRGSVLWSSDGDLGKQRVINHFKKVDDPPRNHLWLKTSRRIIWPAETSPYRPNEVGGGTGRINTGDLDAMRRFLTPKAVGQLSERGFARAVGRPAGNGAHALRGVHQEDVARCDSKGWQ